MHGGEGRVLDPVERLSEILFGVIMALTFTGSIEVAGAGRDDVRALMIGALGCNLAWGLIDAVMYVMAELVTRSRQLQTLREIHAGGSPERADALLAAALPHDVTEHLAPEELAGVRRWIQRLPDPAQRSVLTPRVWRGALGVFLLVSLSTFPMVLPFLLVADLELALRLSRWIALAMLFGIGVALGRHAGSRPLLTGLAMLAIGVVLVLVTIALGG